MQVLLLSGGGSRGAYQAGCWAAIHESGWRPDRVIGTSVGAINGAMIVGGADPGEMRHWWTTIRQKDIMRIRKDVWRAGSWTGFYDQTPLRKLLERNLDLAALKESETDLWVCATDLQAGRHVVFKKQELTVEHFLASAALTPGLPAVRLDDHLYADGGISMNPAIRPAVEGGAEHLEVLLHSPVEPRKVAEPRGPRATIWRNSEIYWHERLRTEIAGLRDRTRLPVKEQRHLAPFTMRIHAPDPPIGNDMLRFEPKEAAEMYDRGYVETQARLEKPPE